VIVADTAGVAATARTKTQELVERTGCTPSPDRWTQARPWPSTTISAPADADAVGRGAAED